MEWLFMKALARESLIAHRLEFLKVVVNGDDLGIYAVQEQYGKRLIENNQRREGPIVGFDKDALFLAEAAGPTFYDQWYPDSFWRAPIDGTQFTSPRPRPA